MTYYWLHNLLQQQLCNMKIIHQKFLTIFRQTLRYFTTLWTCLLEPCQISTHLRSVSLPGGHKPHQTKQFWSQIEARFEAFINFCSLFWMKSEWGKSSSNENLYLSPYLLICPVCHIYTLQGCLKISNLCTIYTQIHKRI